MSKSGFETFQGNTQNIRASGAILTHKVYPELVATFALQDVEFPEKACSDVSQQCRTFKRNAFAAACGSSDNNDERNVTFLASSTEVQSAEMQASQLDFSVPAIRDNNLHLSFCLSM